MILITKKVGETLSELVARARYENSIQENVSITYAGRLDPMASGEMILLVGDEVHEKEKYSGLDKEYSFEVVFDIETDTLDVLGIVKLTPPLNSEVLLTTDSINGVAQSFVGEYVQKYPAYSSKPIDGLPSFAHARAGTNVGQPTHMVSLRSVSVEQMRIMRIVDCAREAVERVGCVAGDFRQDKIIDSWQELARAHGSQEVVVVKMRAIVGSGFYIRVFASEIAQKLGRTGIAWSIHRERILTS